MSGLEQWVAYRTERTAVSARLICLPYAGAGAALYRSWPSLFPPEIDVVPVQLPGRENRLREPPITELKRLIPELAQALLPLVHPRTTLFGYSMGALLAFELAREWRRYGVELTRLVVAACPAPQLHRFKPYQYSRTQLIERMRQLGGTPEAVLDNNELMSALLPAFGADLQLFEQYRYRAEPPLSCPIVALGGEADREVELTSLEAWAAMTSAPFESVIFPHGHFFLHEDERSLVRRIASLV